MRVTLKHTHMTKPKKHLGQNFLQDESILAQIIDAAELTPEDQILEIGPGKGVLTDALLQKTKQVTAVEIDEDLLPSLRSQFSHHKNFNLVHEDALKFQPPEAPYKIVANIPYYITSPLLNHYLQNPNPPSLLVLMIQKEVAHKILAPKGKHSVLSLQVHIFGNPELICEVPASAFTPQPKVDSAVLRIRVHPKPKIPGDIKKLFWLIHMSFAQKRKKLTNNLAPALQKSPAEIRELLTSLNIDPDIRAEALTLDEWQKLFKHTNSS